MGRLLRLRIALPAAMGLLLILVCGSVALLARPQGAGLLVPGATQVRTQRVGYWELRMSYDAPGPPYGWYFRLSRDLQGAGWEAQPFTGGLRSNAQVYFRLTRLWTIYLAERVALQGEPNSARITFRRELIVPWRTWLP